MTVNMGKIDRAARVLVAGVLIYLGGVDTDIIMNSVIRYCLLGFGVVNFLTAVTGFCPMYTLVNISTLKKSDA